MKRRLIQTVQSVFVAAGATAAELVILGLLKLFFSPVALPAIWFVLFDYGGVTAFGLATFLAVKREMKLFEKLVLMLFPLIVVAVNAAQLFPLAPVWGCCFLVELLGAAFGAGFAGCIQISGEQSRIEERYALAIRKP